MNTKLADTPAQEGPRLAIPKSAVARGVVTRSAKRPSRPDASSIFRNSPRRSTDPLSLLAHAAEPVQPVAPNVDVRLIQPITSTDPRSPRLRGRKARKGEAKLMRRIENAVSRGDRKTAEHLRRVYTRSLDAKIVAMLDTSRERYQRRLPAPVGLQAIQAAECIDVRQAPTEPVTVFRKVKGRGKTRVIQAFGPLHAARQKLVCRAMKPFLAVDPRQYATQNGGRPAACRAVVAHMQEAKWAVEVDIADFYPSADKEWLLRHLPLDASALSSTLLLEDAVKNPRFSQHLYERCIDGPISLLADARFGLPQGASTSALAADRIVAEIMRSIPCEVPIVNFADNFLVLGNTRAELERSLETLRTAARRCPAGRLLLTVRKTRRLIDGVDFLGYRFRACRGSPVVMPSSKNTVMLKRRVGRLLLHVHREGRNNSRIKLKRYIDSWRAAFDLTLGLGFFVFTALRDLFLPIAGNWMLRLQMVDIGARGVR